MDTLLDKKTGRYYDIEDIEDLLVKNNELGKELRRWIDKVLELEKLEQKCICKKIIMPKSSGITKKDLSDKVTDFVWEIFRAE